MNVLSLRIEYRREAFNLNAALEVQNAPLALIGPNGAGKTSLLLAILGVLQPQRGRITVADEVLYDERENICRPTEERRIGYVPQDYALFERMTVRENIEFGLRCLPSSTAPSTAEALHRRAEQLLVQLDLTKLADRRPHTLSGGEKQRVALARALAPSPCALLLDEPLAALDLGARREVRQFLGPYLRTLGVPTILVTHDPKDARALADRVVALERGTVVQTGTLDELARQPATPFVDEFTRN